MAVDIGQIVAAAVAVLAPFMPFLMDVGKTSGRKLAEVIAEKGGEASWEKAQDLWDKIKARFDDDSEVKGAAIMVATKPDDEPRQLMLAEVLSTRLKERPELTQELFHVLGGAAAVQQVLADHSSWVEGVTQIDRKSGGTQSVIASDNSVIKGVRQIKG